MYANETPVGLINTYTVYVKKIHKMVFEVIYRPVCLPQDTLCLLYNSLVLSHLNYGILAWGYQTDRLYKLQKKAVRIISLGKFNCHSEPLFKKLQLLKIKDIHTLQELKFYHQLKNNQLPSYFRNMTNDHDLDTHPYPTRHKNKLRSPRTNHEFARKCIRYSAIKTAINTSNHIIEKVNTHSLHGFMTYFKRITIDQYELSCRITIVTFVILGEH